MKVLRNSYGSVPEQLVSVPEQLVSVPEQLLSLPEQLLSLPEQLISAPEQLGYADFLHTMTPIRFHTLEKLHGPCFDMKAHEAAITGKIRGPKSDELRTLRYLYAHTACTQFCYVYFVVVISSVLNGCLWSIYPCHSIFCH